MNCDICGNKIVGQPFRVRVEGANMLVCHRCQKLGKAIQEPAPVAPRPQPRPQVYRQPRAAPRPRRKAELPKDFEELELSENYSALIREARSKFGLSQEQLAQRVKERLSIIQKIETGRMSPDTRLSRALEHELRIKLLVPRKEIPTPTKGTGAPAVTLGDIIQVKGKAKDELQF